MNVKYLSESVCEIIIHCPGSVMFHTRLQCHEKPRMKVKSQHKIIHSSS